MATASGSGSMPKGAQYSGMDGGVALGWLHQSCHGSLLDPQCGWLPKAGRHEPANDHHRPDPVALFCCIPYLGTAVLVESFDYPWVNLKLSNKGFQHALRVGQALASRISDTSVTLSPQETLQHFPALGQAAEPYFSSARVYYNHKAQRIDMKLSPRPGQDRALLLAFEPGYPYMDDDAEVGNIP